MPPVSIVIVSYRVRDFLEACLRSIRDNGMPGETEVVVVDNASGDETVQCLAPRFPEVRWIQNAENVGFARAANQGIRATSGEYILLLSPDGKLLPGGLECLVRFMQTRQEIGVVGPRMLLSDGRPYVSVFPFPTIASILFYETRLNRVLTHHPLTHPYDQNLQRAEPFRVDAVEGSCFLARRKAWEAAGGFDSRYFFGFEDMDFAWRVRQTGWEIWFHPFPVAVHHHSGSTGGKRRGTLVLVSVGLGQMYFLREHQPIAYAILRLPLLVIFAAKWVLCFLLGRDEQKVAFREVAKSLIGMRASWITAEDLRRWG